jgi:putative heme-binding domain-containing protein
MKSLSSIALLLAFLSLRAQAADPFAENVRTTDPLTPGEEVKTFKLPPGFKIDLVASEPDINKPMNIAFDTKGRLWVSSSREYPFPVPLDKPAHDSIKIFEDFDENGHARKVTTFVDGLNIPIGLYPYKDGVIAWSIPNIWFFRDTDGDGKADKREILYGPFGWQRDTHGNQASFSRGFDGWIYATHGYNNISHVKAPDGSEINIHSGNTYRFARDGSHIESNTYGQVNPFGLWFDHWGNLYSADCHSQPIYDLIRGGCYPSFGKPNDGLGFAPDVMDHEHGSTAICGIILYEDNLWPAEFQNTWLTGDVMSSRLDRDTMVAHGTSKKARHEEPFLTTTDPWFRPNSMTLGPDGALYVTDFYNRIIGHYEVPLTHPGRDRERGRIWKVSYTGKPLHELPNLSRRSAAELILEFRSPNEPTRMLAMNELADRVGTSAVPEIKSALEKKDAPATEIVHCLWSLQRLNALDADLLRAFASNKDDSVRTHVMHILSENPNFAALRKTIGVRGLEDANPIVERAAADALGRFPDAPSYVHPLLNLLARIPSYDDHLRHTARIALRNQFRDDGAALTFSQFKPQEAKEIASVCLGITNSASAAFLIQHIQTAKEPTTNVTEYVRHAARYVPAEGVPNLTAYIREHYKSELDQQLSFFKAIQEGSAQRGLEMGPDLRAWGADLATNLLAYSDSEAWRNYAIPGKPTSTNPWFLQKRPSSDGDKGSLFLCSLPPGGERLTGVLRSRTFTVPKHLKFYFAGHDGFPNNAALGNNMVRLVSVDGRELAKAAPPRNDTAQPVEWDLSADQGQQAQLELIDGDTGSAYAWIAVGRFEPEVVRMPSVNPNQASSRVQAAAEMAKTLQLASLAPRLGGLLQLDSVDMDAQVALGTALVALEPNQERLALVPLLGDNSIAPGLRRNIAEAIAFGHSRDSVHTGAVLIEAMKSTPARVQLKIAQSLAGSAAGAETLFAMVEKRQAAPRVLLDKTVQDKIAALQDQDLRAKHAELTKNLEPANEAVQKQIETARAKYNSSKPSPVEGVKVFTQNCAICHRIDGNGAVIGPQLDGIGSRGLERLLEDVLDPNRNVDVNFRTQIVVLKDGDVLSGLFRREEGELLILADSTGKEVSIPKKDIQSRRESETSLMPANFGDIIPEHDFQNLMSFLLSRGVPGPR